MSITDTAEVLSYHTERMKECCATLLTISSFDKDVTQAIVLGGTIQRSSSSKFHSDLVCELETPGTCAEGGDVARWLEATSHTSGMLFLNYSSKIVFYD